MRGRPTEKLKAGTPQNVAEVLRDHEGAPHFFCRLDNLCRFLRVHRHGFFEQHMLACLQGVNRDAGVKIIGSGDGHGVDIGLIEQVVIIGVGAGNFVTIGGFLEAFRVDFGNGYCGGARAMEDAVEMSEAETTGSNHRTTKSFVHNCW